MSRRRSFDEPLVHGYWPHSDPEPPQGGPHGTTTERSDLMVPAGDDPCPGPCNREFRQAELEHLDGNHDVPFHPGQPVWCKDVTHVTERHQVVVDHHGCQERITADLRDLPSLAAALAPGALNTPRDIRADDRGMGSTTLVHPPTNSPGWDTADDLIRWALHLEDQLRDRLGMEPATQPARLYVETRVLEWRPPLTRPVVVERWAVPTSRHATTPRTLSAAVRFLATYSTALLSGPDAEQIGRQIMGRRRQLEQRTGRDRLVHRLPGTCLVCDRKGLRRPDGGDLVKCPSCGATWAWEQYELLARAYADDVRRRGA